MMTVPMDNTLKLASRDCAQQLFNKNVELEARRRRSAQARIPSDPNTWQQMRENYEAIILVDHTFSEQHEIEYALWQLHYRRIEELRTHYNAALSSAGSNLSQNGKGAGRPDRISKIRSQFKAFLSEASGFYHDLMLKIRAKYGLPLGYFSDESENESVPLKDGDKSVDMKKGLISCHRCLIYLGDLARYKGLYGEGDSKVRDFAAASSYYTQASSLLPSSGNPHHQLAILASYSGDELVAIYRYFRSLAVDNPFSTARENLVIAFEKNRQSYSQLPGHVKASPLKSAPVRPTVKARGRGGAKLPLKDNKIDASSVKVQATDSVETLKSFCIHFVRINGILFTRTSLETFKDVFSITRAELLELLSSGPKDEYGFGSSAAENGLFIVRLVAILIFTVYNVNRESENQSYAEILQRSALLQNAFTALFQFMGQILERCIQLDDPSQSCLLPGVLVFVEWLACCSDIAAANEVEEEQASARSFFWNHCISFLNKLLVGGFISMNEDEDETCFFNVSAYKEGETASRMALWEDFELRGFLPLLPAQLILDFSRKHSYGMDGSIKEKKARVQRIISAGKVLANVVQPGRWGIYFDRKMKQFSSGVEPKMSVDAPLTTSLEVLTLKSAGEEHPSEEKLELEAKNLQSVQLLTEGEDDDEVIVFQPSVAERHAEVTEPKLTPFDSFGSSNNLSRGDLGNPLVPFQSLYGGFAVQNAFNVSVSAASVSNNVSQQLQPITPGTDTSKWLSDTATGMRTSSIMDNGFSMKPVELHGSRGQDPTASVSHSVNSSVAGVYVDQFPETVIPSKFDAIMLSGATFDAPGLSSTITQGNVKKNPVGRPVRHFGPPPGFSTMPLKHVDESSPVMISKSEDQLMDDYSWLDDYQAPAWIGGSGFDISVDHPAKIVSNKANNGLIGNLNFPFPGKQVSASRQHVETHKGQNYQFAGHLKFHRDQQLQQLQIANQQFTPLQQYNMQSPWDNRFLV